MRRDRRRLLAGSAAALALALAAASRASAEEAASEAAPATAAPAPKQGRPGRTPPLQLEQLLAEERERLPCSVARHVLHLPQTETLAA